MTEQQWAGSTNPVKMLAHLDSLPVIPPLGTRSRKLRLFACGCVRGPWDQLVDDQSREAVVVAERYADGQASAAELVAAREAAFRAWPAVPELVRPLHRAAQKAAGWDPRGSAEDTASEVRRVGQAQARRSQADLLRCIFGNPFRPWPAIDPAWLQWNDGTVPRLAQAIYDERRWGDMALLGDALLDAGCDNEEALAHCRAAGEHVRGCWMVDLLLGRS